jgi:hypothetical protein
MNTLKRLVMAGMDMAFVFLAMNALVIVFGFSASLLVTSGHDHWTATGFALALTVALRIFVWLLPLTALVFFIGSLLGAESSAGDPK